MSDGTDKNAAVGFFPALIGICCGTAVFDRLVRQPLWRVLLHMVMLTLLCAFGVSWAMRSGLSSSIAAKMESFRAEFGNFVVSDSGVEPLLRPEEKRLLRLWPSGGVIYAPAAADAAALFPEDWSVGLVWSKNVLSLVGRDETSGRYVYLLPMATLPYFGTSGVCDRAGLSRMLEQFPVATTVAAAQKLDLPRLSGTEAVASGVQSMFFTAFALTALLMQLILTTVFSLVYRFLGTKPFGVVLNYGELFRIGIYAGFPALVLAGAFPAFDLPLLDFDQAYSLGLVLYMLVTISAMTRRRLTPKTQEE